MLASVQLVLLTLTMFYVIPLATGEFLSRFLNADLADPYYVLVIGRDKNIQGTVRADAIVLVGISFSKKKILITNVPRDLLWNGRKVNSYFNGGVNELKNVVEEIAGITVNAYAVFDYDAFVILGDELGPVRVTVKQPMEYVDEVQDLRISFLPGVHELHGKELLAYVRYRKGGLGDLDRIRRQREVFKELLKKALSIDLAKALKLYEKLLDYIQTDLNTEDFVSIALKSKGMSISFISLPTAITPSGDLVLDESRMGSFRRALLEFQTPSPTKEYRVVIVNAKKVKSRYFRPIEEKRWEILAGFKPVDVVWEDTGFRMKGSYLIVCTKKHEIKEELQRIVEKVYDKRDFKVLWAAYMQGAKLYYTVLKNIHSIKKYLPRPIDALVILGDVDVK